MTEAGEKRKTVTLFRGIELTLGLSRNEVTKEVSSDCIVAWQIGFGNDSQEPVALNLASKLRCHFSGIHVHLLTLLHDDTLANYFTKFKTDYLICYEQPKKPPPHITSIYKS